MNCASCGSANREGQREWLTAQNRTAEASELLARAATTFVQLGAVAWLRRAVSHDWRDTQPTAATAMPA